MGEGVALGLTAVGLAGLLAIFIATIAGFAVPASHGLSAAIGACIAVLVVEVAREVDR